MGWEINNNESADDCGAGIARWRRQHRRRGDPAGFASFGQVCAVIGMIRVAIVLDGDAKGRDGPIRERISGELSKIEDRMV